jgi:hypothetical protein
MDGSGLFSLTTFFSAVAAAAAIVSGVAIYESPELC